MHFPHPRRHLLLALILEAAIVHRSVQAFQLNAVQKANRDLARGPFDPCGGTHALTKVEAVKAQAFSTRVFHKCGTSILINFASMVSVPDFYMVALASLTCKGIILTYSVFSKTTDLIIPAGITAQQLLESVDRFLLARTRGAPPKKKYRDPRNRSVVYYSNPETLAAFIRTVAKCAFELDESGPMLDANVLLRTVRYYKFVVL